jgi:nitronate monooxygenase
VAQRVFDRYFRRKSTGRRAFAGHALPAARSPRSLEELTVVASFAETFLAKADHPGEIGINLLEKIQLATLPTLFGSMLAGVDWVLMGAGIPRAIPGVLDRLSRLEQATLSLDVSGARAGEKFETSFDPSRFVTGETGALRRPRFLAIVSSATLAMTLARKSSGRVDGFVVEGPSAGGHNAPPRGASLRSEAGEPVYGPRDTPDLDKIRELGLPFWMAGSYGRPGGLDAALALGAAGIQVGTAFAFCAESGMREDLKTRVLQESIAGRAQVFTDPRASPTGFPLKVVQLDGTVADPAVYLARPKLCDLGYLRQSYRRPDGSLGYRCPGEPVEDYLKKGGDPEEIAGRKCVCNGLLATVGLGQVQQDGYEEPALVTAGTNVACVAEFLSPGAASYTAADVIGRLLGERAGSGCQGHGR